jgi:hypothetical protein
MNYPNLISTRISEQDLNEIQGAISFIDEKLSDLITISELEKSTLYKANCDTVKFVKENLKLAEKNPELVPGDISIDEIRKDVELIESINKIMKPLNELTRKLKDSKTVAGSEAYLPSMAIYNAIQAHAIQRKKRPGNTVSV